MADVLTIKEVATRLECSARTVRNAIRAGRLRVIRLGKGARSDRVHPDDLEAFINAARTQGDGAKESAPAPTPVERYRPRNPVTNRATMPYDTD